MCPRKTNVNIFHVMSQVLSHNPTEINCNELHKHLKRGRVWSIWSQPLLKTDGLHKDDHKLKIDYCICHAPCNCCNQGQQSVQGQMQQRASWQASSYSCLSHSTENLTTTGYLLILRFFGNLDSHICCKTAFRLLIFKLLCQLWVFCITANNLTK